MQAETSIRILYDDIRGTDCVKDIDPIIMSIKRLLLWGYQINKQQLEQIVSCLQNLSNNMRHYANRGYTPNEMRTIYGPVNPNKITMSIDPNMRKMFESGELDPKEYLDGIRRLFAGCEVDQRDSHYLCRLMISRM